MASTKSKTQNPVQKKKKWQCSVCNKRFSTKSGRKQHHSTKHDPKNAFLKNKSSFQQPSDFIRSVVDRSRSSQIPRLIMPKKLLIFYKQYQKNPTNSHALGNYNGILFETYATALLLETAHNNETIQWIIPSSVKAPRLKGKNRRERLTYNAEGEIILYDGLDASAEFDGILQLNNQIFLCEMKYGFQPGKKPFWKILNRLEKFNALYKVHVKLLLIIPSHLTSFSKKENYESHPDIRILQLENFSQYREKFEKTVPKELRTHWKGAKSKIKSPHEIFPKKFDFTMMRKQLLEAFQQVCQDKLSTNDFLQNQRNPIAILGYLPIGKLASDCSLNSLEIQGNNRIVQFLQSGTPCIMFVKFRFPEIHPVIVIYTKSNNPGRPRLYRSEFDLTLNRFTTLKPRVRAGTVRFSLAKQVAKESKAPIMGLLELKKLIEACKDLTEAWKRNAFPLDKFT